MVEGAGGLLEGGNRGAGFLQLLVGDAVGARGVVVGFGVVAVGEARGEAGELLAAGHLGCPGGLEIGGEVVVLAVAAVVAFLGVVGDGGAESLLAVVEAEEFAEGAGEVALVAFEGEEAVVGGMGGEGVGEELGGRDGGGVMSDE